MTLIKLDPPYLQSKWFYARMAVTPIGGLAWATYGGGPRDIWFAGASAIILAMVAVRAEGDRTLDRQRAEIAELTKSAAADQALIEGLRSEASRYRRAYAYAAEIRKGKTPVQAAFDSAKESR